MSASCDSSWMHANMHQVSVWSPQTLDCGRCGLRSLSHILHVKLLREVLDLSYIDREDDGYSFESLLKALPNVHSLSLGTRKPK
jgi:hypothetical protein